MSKVGKRSLRSAFALSAGLSVIVLTPTLSAQLVGRGSASATTQSASPMTSNIMTAAEAVAYWTPERMASARPVGPLTVSTGGALAAPAANRATGAPGFTNGVPPGGEEAPTLPLASPGGGGGIGTLAVGYHTPIPFTRWQYFAIYKRYPIYPVGKLFFSNDGGNWVCSGSVIAVNTVWTAGHCTSNTDGTHQWSTNVLFCPVYDNGAPNPGVGCWAGLSLSTWNQWFTYNSLEWDMGSIGMSTCGTVNCMSIGNFTGWLGFAWNYPEEQHWMHFGYPQGAPFNGNKIQVCASEFGYEDSDGNNQSGPNSLATGCDQTGGSSGGPWIMSWGLPGQIGGGAGNWVNGHQDWYHTAFPNEINTPYFDTRACTLANAQGLGATC